MGNPDEQADAVHPTANLPVGTEAVLPDWTQNVAIRFDQFTLLPVERRLLKSGEDIRLGGRAFDILLTLIERAPALVGKAELFDRVWPGQLVEDGNLRVQIQLLRKALGDDQAATLFISTVPGRGYCFIANVARTAYVRGAAASGLPEAPKTNLPLPMHAIIDRERELAELADSLRQHRLVSVVGSGGVGKTRLAIELGRWVLPHYPDGVWLVDMAPLSDPALIVRATAMALDLSFGGAEPTAEGIAKRISRRRLLLIFDNCEHLVDAVAALIVVLVSQASALTVLATSQESLRVADEQIHRLAPLSVAPAGAADIARYGAVALFVDLVRRIDRRFVLSAGNAESVADICRHLDGVPLALEMAAARLPLLGLDGLRAGLTERFSLLKGEPRRSDRRHPTLRHVVEWSHGLLDPIEQTIFRRLAVFPGSFSLEAAAAIMAPLGIDRWDALDTLWRLREKSLIVVEHGKAPRYRLLETLRIYAIEKLQASSDEDAVAEQHARYFAEVFQTADAAWETMPDPDWAGLYRPEIDNLRAAVGWALADPGRRHIALTLGGPSLHIMWISSLVAEGRRYGDRLFLLIDDDTPPAITAGLLYGVARFGINTRDSRSLDYLERAAALYRELGDRPRLARTLSALGGHHALLGQLEQGKASLDEAMDLHAQNPLGKARISTILNLGFIAAMANRYSEAHEYITQALDVARTLHSFDEPLCLMNLSTAEYALGDVHRAVERGREAVSCARATPGHRGLVFSLINLAAFLLAQDNSQEARAFAAEAFVRLAETEMPALSFLQIWAVLAAFEGRLVEAARLIGFVDAERVRKQNPLHSSTRPLHDALMRRLEAGFSAADLQVLQAEGALWSEAEALESTSTWLVAVTPTATN